ncbi:MAG: acetyl-CoA carboxylase biotin carboxyl carrier protein [Lachnospiraceae bacterium]|nr:acetyl-CoA carboxylase biotin carboxyl carrier protein [Lachnospiraceae bacterium]
MKFGLDEIFAVIDKVTESGLASFVYEDADTKISIQGGGRATVAANAYAPGNDFGVRPTSAPETDFGAGASPTSAQANALKPDTPAKDCAEITSMMVGTFYAAPSEDAEPFVRIGDAVKKGQTVGIVEAMKLMNEIESEYDGVVDEILVKNGQLVEYGQPLMRIRRNEK